MTVVPDVTGVKTPPASMVAVAGVPLDHVPPVGVAVMVMSVPMQVAAEEEVMLTVGKSLTVIVPVAVTVPQPPVSVTV